MALDTPIKVGSRIWRPIVDSAKGPYLPTVDFERAPQGYRFKAARGRGSFTSELIAYNAGCLFGTICLISEPPASRWTYLEVAHVLSTGSVVARPVEGDPQELYAKYPRIKIDRDLFAKTV